MNVEVGIVTMTSVDGNIFQGHYYRSVCRSQCATGHKTIRSRFNQESWNFYLRLWKRCSRYKLWLFLHDRFNFCSWYVLSDVSYLKRKKRKKIVALFVFCRITRQFAINQPILASTRRAIVFCAKKIAWASLANYVKIGTKYEKNIEIYPWYVKKRLEREINIIRNVKNIYVQGTLQRIYAQVVLWFNCNTTLTTILC